MSVLPSGLGFWVPWLPFTLPLVWPFCWHLVVVLDHFSRAVVARGVFNKAPTAIEVCSVLDAAVRRAGRPPRHIVSDRGAQFQRDYRAWCERNLVKPRFGAIGRHGSIAVIERWFHSFKDECMRNILVPLAPAAMLAEVDAYLRWYHEHRPHQALRGATPAEMFEGVVPACERPGVETRLRYPLARGDPATPPRKRCRGQLELAIQYVEHRKHLPVIELCHAA